MKTVEILVVLSSGAQETLILSVGDALNMAHSIVDFAAAKPGYSAAKPGDSMVDALLLQLAPYTHFSRHPGSFACVSFVTTCGGGHGVFGETRGPRLETTIVARQAQGGDQ